MAFRFSQSRERESVQRMDGRRGAGQVDCTLTPIVVACMRNILHAHFLSAQAWIQLYLCLWACLLVLFSLFAHDLLQLGYARSCLALSGVDGPASWEVGKLGSCQVGCQWANGGAASVARPIFDDIFFSTFICLVLYRVDSALKNWTTPGGVSHWICFWTFLHLPIQWLAFQRIIQHKLLAFYFPFFHFSIFRFVIKSYLLYIFLHALSNHWSSVAAC